MTATQRVPAESAEVEEVPRSVARLLDVLELAIERGPINLSGVADAAGLTPTTTLRYLRALETREYVSRLVDGSYTPGPVLAGLASTVVSSNRMERLVARAQRHLDALATTTGESAYLAVRDDNHAVYLATAQSSRPIRHVGWVGQRVPLKGSAVGAALERVGHAVDRIGAVEPDIAAVAIALPSDDGAPVALSVVGPAHRFDRDGVARVCGALASVVADFERELAPGEGLAR